MTELWTGQRDYHYDQALREELRTAEVVEELPLLTGEEVKLK